MSNNLSGIGLVIIATFIEAIGQLCLKRSTSKEQNGKNANKKVLWLAAGSAILLFEAVLWTSVLHILDVSVAYPMGSLCFVFVAILSRLFLAEKVTAFRYAGVFLIILGTVLVGLK